MSLIKKTSEDCVCVCVCVCVVSLVMSSAANKHFKQNTTYCWQSDV